MEILAWNCQGLNKPLTNNHLKYLSSTEHPDIIFFSETKAKDTAMANYFRKCSFNNWISIPPLGKSGGLWFAWKDGLGVEMVHHSRNMVNAIMRDGVNQTNWLLTALYGPLNKATRLEVWKFIEEIGIEVNLPWVLLGDLNVIFNHSEKCGGNAFRMDDVRDVLDFIDSSGLVDLGFCGHPYTWNNQRHGWANVRERLDRALSNPA
ncbi:Endonuclease/exonuclease/phosphatase [Macleaya cordata]|uniref:Endonuclease/exonuclease/phosphatase n=1 Tax=Macleaya cordata TaxID=56857 RepID=A0A200PPC0_MACCD|nr:Endonuclease/exonuclease/phosphatase [Macleaya cordata]